MIKQEFHFIMISIQKLSLFTTAVNIKGMPLLQLYDSVTFIVVSSRDFASKIHAKSCTNPLGNDIAILCRGIGNSHCNKGHYITYLYNCKQNNKTYALHKFSGVPEEVKHALKSLHPSIHPSIPLHTWNN
jgi:hypothetical protein